MQKLTACFLSLVLQITLFRDALAFSSGAPTAACGDLAQQHPGVTPMVCGPACQFSVSLVAIDGSPLTTSPNMYRCGSQHTFRIETSDQDYRGFAIQARETTSTFSSSANFVGEFINPPPDTRIWNCAAPSATHINNNFKSSVEVNWQAPGDAISDVTLWFSITQVFSTVYAQIRGLDLSPDPAFCNTGATDIVVEFDPVMYGPFTEGAQQSVIFRLVAQTTPTEAITVLFSTVSQTAIASEDFVPRENLPVTFGAGEIESFVEVLLIDDNVYETQECFMAVLGLLPGSSGIQLGQQSQANVVILDDDEVTVSFNPSSYTVNEGETVNFLVELMGEAQVNVAVMFQTRSVSAIGGQDYASLTGVVSFSPGASTFSVPIVTSTDSLSEGDEVFEGVLTLAPGSERINLGADVATAVIRNSAPPVPQNVCQIYARTEL